MFGNPPASSFPEIHKGTVLNVLTLGSQIREAELKLCTRHSAPVWQIRRTGKLGAAKIYMKMPPPSEGTVSFRCGRVEDASIRFLPHQATLAPP
jgi:hypothetical protein